jgi:hypothetical protein
VEVGEFPPALAPQFYGEPNLTEESRTFRLICGTFYFLFFSEVANCKTIATINCSTHSTILFFNHFSLNKANASSLPEQFRIQLFSNPSCINNNGVGFTLSSISQIPSPSTTLTFQILVLFPTAKPWLHKWFQLSTSTRTETRKQCYI